METAKTKNLRVRLRRVKPSTASGLGGTSLCAPSPSAVSVKVKRSSERPSSSSKVAAGSSSDSDDDNSATVHFKLAAAYALEAAAAQSPQMSFDWQSMKTALISEARSMFKASEAASTSAAAADAMTEEDDEAATPTEPPPTPTEETAAACGVSVRQLAADTGGSCSSSSSTCSDSYGRDIRLISPETLAVADACTADGTPIEHNVLLSRLPPFSDAGISVVDDPNPTEALTKILSLPPFDTHAPQLQVQLIIKSVVSLPQLSLREDNEIQVEIKKSSIMEFSKGIIGTNEHPLSPFMDVSNIHVKHRSDEFCTFCSCKKCVEYREIVIHIMVEQFKAAHMVVMLLDVLIKAYGPMLKNVTAYNKFEKLLDANKEIYWIACGFVYNKKAEHMDFIYDDSLSDNMIFVLFSSILMVNNPLLLLQILAFHVECIVKAYAEGFLEIVEPDNNKIPAEEMLTYILDGYDDLCRISEQISCYLFAFENDFLRKFSLTWTLLCQRLYQQHVFANLTDTMLACLITLKEDELTTRHAALIKKYIQFDDKMNYVEKRWTEVWIELNKFNLSEDERKRRKCLLDVYRIFDTVVQDAIAFSLQESGDDNDFYDFQCLENRRLAWQNIMAYTKMKWPDGFFEPPNTLVCDEKCKKCGVMLEYHMENCKCITCSIAGGPLPPRRNPDSTCYKCLAHSLVEKEVNFYESKIVNVCASDDFLSFLKNSNKRRSTTLVELGEEVSANLPLDNTLSLTDDDGIYHLSWAVFNHFNNRRRYKHASIEAKDFCTDCKMHACLLARKILNNEVAPTLSAHLTRYYQPLTMSREELRSILPNIMLYNRKMIAFNIGFDLTDVHDLVVKIYWTFIISLYATYFMEFDEKCPLNLCNLEIVNNDIRVCAEKLVGNKDDTKFGKFLDKIKSLSPFKSQVESDFAFTVDVHTEEIQNKLDKLLNINEIKIPPSGEKVPPATANVTETATSSDENLKKASGKEKPTKKCCFDHSDLGDHCKENHSSKKRIKKECNHARMNETRDRLRKKLSQLVNARKNMKTGSATGIGAEPACPSNNQPPAATIPTTTKQPPTLKFVATAAAAATAACAKTHAMDEEDDSLECLSTLCKRISHLHTKANANHAAVAASASKKINPAAAPTLTPTKTVQNCSDSTAEKDINVGISSKAANSLDMVSEIYEFLDNYSKDQTKVKKWINDTLSYIEGSSAGGGGKKQPQPTNPKKAAKKAKQKQRKEEEKRIAELQDMRAQFHDIYFKEFTDKQRLKTLKASKKRDKKTINELETNIKKLQRAKAKVETVILELIATVKQTNTEFKFAYLPTKEQQMEKLREMEAPATAASQQQQSEINNLNVIAAGNYNIPPYAYTATANLPAAAAFAPYQIDFQAQGAPPAYGLLRPGPPTPMCYAPPQQQQLSPDVVAAMAANASADPSKRIVTIRRVNLPNVPEPQVTVTAKGSSPDKDKLLYTFVNGQLVPTDGSGAQQRLSTDVAANPVELAALQQQQLMMPPPKQLLATIPPPPPLSKTQAKKERRRLAKQAAEEAAAESERLREEQERARLAAIELEKQQAAAAKLSKKATKKAKEAKKPAVEVKSENIVDSKAKKKNQKQPTAAVVTKGEQRRSESTTTSCSLATSSASATPLTSQVNTRDNSVCSQKPMATSKKTTKQAVEAAKEASKKSVPILKKPKPFKASATKPEQQPATTPQPPPAPAPTAVALEKPKKTRAKRSRFVDSGQFDNNPFKSLNMVDSSDSEFDDSATSSYDENDVITAPVPAAATSTAPAPRTRVVSAPQASQLDRGSSERTKAKSKSHADAAINQPSKNSSRTIIAPPEATKSTRHAKQREVPNRLAQPPTQQQKQTQNRAKSDNRPLSTQAPSSSSSSNSNTKQRNGVSSARYERSAPAAGASNSQTPSRSSTRNTGQRHKATEQIPATVDATGKPLSKRAQKQALRVKKYQKQQQHQHNSSHASQYDDCGAGIPNHMGYFNPNELPPPPPQHQKYQQQQQQQQQHYNNLPQQMQALRLGQHQTVPMTVPHSYANISNVYQVSNTGGHHKPTTSALASNVSIMDQLNRGVQVENLSLPPGITLTKVDPIKSEQLRQKSESIKKLSKPLQSQAAPSMPSQAFHHPGATIIAPPHGYYAAPPYAGVAAAAIDQNAGGIIMVEANPQPSAALKQGKANVAAAAAAATASGKTTKSKKRRNKPKQDTAQGGNARSGNAHGQGASGGGVNMSGGGANQQAKMITLRNPMFHGGAASAAASILQQQPGLIPGRPPLSNMPMAAALPMDQPAAIIKNENGMFTIRNPALHQAVTNGLALGGYRQFGNVNYYTPQEAAAEAARATQQSVASSTGVPTAAATSSEAASSFSFFSNSSNGAAPPQPSHVMQQSATSTTSASPSGSSNGNGAGIGGAPPMGNTHNTISISCTSVGGGLSGDAAVIARPTPPQKCISAIGSEIKSAQQQKQKSKEHQWPAFSAAELGGTAMPMNATDNLSCGNSTFLGGSTVAAGVASGGGLNASTLQEKYQQSSYYNGYDVFGAAKSGSNQMSSSTSNAGSLFDGTDCHMHHHNCGDESPPPTITGFNSYLEGIPNTGVIRYDDASFLKNLIPGQNLNNEVSIHNVNDSNFTRSTTSPVAHRVEITPVYAPVRPTSTNIYEHCSTSGAAQQTTTEQQQQQNFMSSSVTNYRDNLADYGNDASIFAPNNLMNLNELDASTGGAGAGVGGTAGERFNYDFEAPAEKQKAILDLNELLIKKSSHSHRTSPYDSSMDNFVQNISALQISAPAEEQCCAQQLNGNASTGGSTSSGVGGVSSSNASTSNATATTNGWW